MTRRLRTVLVLLSLGLAASACGGEESPSPAAPPADATDHGHDHDRGPHGGTVLESADGKAHFEIRHDPAAGTAELHVLDADLRPRAADEAPVLQLRTSAGPVALTAAALPGSAPPGSAWRFEGDALRTQAEGRLRVKVDGLLYTPDFAHAHGAEEHGHGPHDGMVAALSDAAGAVRGHLELKLHDDKGDLEAWLYRDAGGTEPLDLPLDAQVVVRFPERGAEVRLAVRDAEQNPDEDGTPTVRAGKTNYFIFPGATGADATWLMGASFQAPVEVEVPGPDGVLRTERFTLRPHTH